MKISSADLKSFLNGAVSLAEEEGGVIPARFTDHQMSVYAQSGTFALRAGASAGACLGLRTDAEALSLSYRVWAGSSQDFYSFDLYADGILYRSVPGLLSQAPAGTLRFSLPEGVKTLQFYLPNLQRTRISDISLDGASFAEPLTGRRRLLCLGDSITQGYLAKTHSFCYASRISRLLNAELLNQGVGAECCHTETLEDNLPDKPDLVTVAFGTNDWSTRSRRHFEEEAARYMKHVAEIYEGSQIAVLSPLPRLDEYKNPEWSLPEARKRLEEIVSDIPGLTLIPGLKLMPCDETLLSDHVHPNNKGFGVIADNLLKLLPGSWKTERKETL